jgi:hypothetical protein
MNDWIPIEINPPKPGCYWTCTVVRSEADKAGRVTVRYCGGEWRNWDGEKWVGLEGLPSHWYGEKQK